MPHRKQSRTRHRGDGDVTARRFTQQALRSSATLKPAGPLVAPVLARSPAHVRQLEHVIQNESEPLGLLLRLAFRAETDDGIRKASFYVSAVHPQSGILHGVVYLGGQRTASFQLGSVRPADCLPRGNGNW
jgi:hypothetical protein